MARDEGPTGLGQRRRAQEEVARHREAVAQTAAPPFVDALPLPRRILADQHGGELTMPIRAATHRFHRDLPASQVWAHDGRVPGPTIEAERGRPVRVSWRNEIDQPYKVFLPGRCRAADHGPGLPPWTSV